MPPRLFIDADGFPHTEATVEAALEAGIGVVVAGNMTQNLARFAGVDGVEVIEVADGPDAADFALFNRLEAGDILLTLDTGLAALALGKGAQVYDGKGRPYREASIDGRLLGRHLAKKVRRGGGRTKGPPKLTPRDRELFAQRLAALLARQSP